jgi:outer membrane biosynthesis protein TonB
VSPNSRLAICAAASVALHGAALDTAAELRRRSASGEYYAAAPKLPTLEVSVLSVPPEASALKGALPPSGKVTTPTHKLAAGARAPFEKPSQTPHAVDSVYYSAHELDVRARPLSDIEPINPDLTGRERGRVVLRLLINEHGTVDSVALMKAEPPRMFGPGMLTPFTGARFSPARKGGVAVKSQMLIELRYGEPEPAR